MNLIDKIKENKIVRNVGFFLAILGPGIITGSVDNDAGGITTYSVAGASYGYGLIWTLIPCFIALMVVQEMNLRMGVFTGKGLADLIRENFGVKITFWIFLGLLIADLGNTATEFAGIAGSMSIFGISKYISVPLTGISVWLLVTKGNYKITERIFLIFSVCLLSYIVSAISAKPDWHQVAMSFVKPEIEWNKEYFGMVLGLIGTTIAPWMQFYMQSAVIEKGTHEDDYKLAMLDVTVGCVATIVVALFIIVSCATTLHQNNIVINEAKDAAISLKPFAGALAAEVFAFGLFVASVFSATILPLATAFYICEAFGFEAGVDKRVEDAPQFYMLFAFILIIGMGIVLIPNAPLIPITIWTQIINAILLPVVLISMILMVNNPEIMGDKVNNKFQNTIGWTTTTVLIILTVFLLGSTLQSLLPH
ncbi:MAG: Nramp family divalent metal transporter [Candidatus Omnitrophica bacterium]|nr:Nramp family divalent metal transporter [Candidatus Omnitrophota bacterium]